LHEVPAIPNEGEIKVKLRAVAGLVVCFILVAACTRGPSPEEARAELVHLKINYDVNTFVERAGASDPVVVKLFLAAGMNPNVRNSDGNTALYAASKCGDLVTVRALLDSGAELKRGPDGGGIAAGIAAVEGHADVALLLLDRMIAQTPSEEARLVGSAFQSAYKLGPDETAVALFVRLRSVANKQDYSRELAAALRLVVSLGNSEAVKHLLEQGASVNGRDQDGDTPLMTAAKAGHIEVIKTLLSKGADLRAESKDGYTACSLAFMGGHYEVGNFLYEKMGKPGNRFEFMEPRPKQ